MAQFDKTFPTLDCSACILTPKMVSAGGHPNITLLTWSEVERVDGYVGSFTVTMRKKARYVNRTSAPAAASASKSVRCGWWTTSSRPGWAIARRSTGPSRRPCPSTR